MSKVGYKIIGQEECRARDYYYGKKCGLLRIELLK